MASYLYHVSLLSAKNSLLRVRLKIIHDDVTSFPKEKNFGLQLLWETQRESGDESSYLYSQLNEQQMSNEWWVAAHSDDFVKSIRTDWKSGIPGVGNEANYLIEFRNERLLEHIKSPLEWHSASYNIKDSLAKYMKPIRKAEEESYLIKVFARKQQSVHVAVFLADLNLAFPSEPCFFMRVIWEPTWRMKISDCFIAAQISQDEITDNEKCETLADEVISAINVLGTSNFPLARSIDDMDEEEYYNFRTNEELWPTRKYELEVKTESYIEHLLPGQMWYSSASPTEFNL